MLALLPIYVKAVPGATDSGIHDPYEYCKLLRINGLMFDEGWNAGCNKSMQGDRQGEILLK
jgi:hypothetical protein